MFDSKGLDDDNRNGEEECCNEPSSVATNLKARAKTKRMLRLQPSDHTSSPTPSFVVHVRERFGISCEPQHGEADQPHRHRCKDDVADRDNRARYHQIKLPPVPATKPGPLHPLKLSWVVLAPPQKAPPSQPAVPEDGEVVGQKAVDLYAAGPTWHARFLDQSAGACTGLIVHGIVLIDPTAAVTLGSSPRLSL